MCKRAKGIIDQTVGFEPVGGHWREEHWIYTEWCAFSLPEQVQGATNYEEQSTILVGWFHFIGFDQASITVFGQNGAHMQHEGRKETGQFAC